MPNQYKNKVVYGNTTIIDITDTTAVASDVASGKYFYLATGEKVQGTASGGGGGVVVVETQDSHGGTIIEITAEEVRLQAKTNVTPTTSSQLIEPDTGYTGLSSVQINAMPSGTAGTPTATKGTVSNHAISVTPSVTNTAGYIAGGTKTGTGISVSASELVSGTYTVDSSGTKDVTNYASASVPAGAVTAPSTITGSSATVSTGTNTLTLSKTVSVTPSVTTAGYVSSGTVGDSAVSLTASVNTRSSSDLIGNVLTVTAPAGYYGSDATKTLTDANLLATNIKKNISIFGVTGSYEGSGGGGATVGTATNTPTTNVTSISFAVSGNPILFVVQMNKNNSYINGSSSRYITSAANNGSTVYTTALYKSGSTAREYTYSTSSWSYSNGTLTITSAGGSTAGYFTTSEYRLIYAY